MGHARNHFQRVTAAAQAAAAPAAEPMEGSEHQLMLAQLYEHRKQLKQIQSVERKVEAKAAMVPVYDTYIGAVLQAGQGAQDDIVTTLMVWNIDAGAVTPQRYEQALTIAAYVLQHGLKLPDQYNRDVPTLLADEFSTAALAGKMPAEQELDMLLAVDYLTLDRDMPDQARAKLRKAIGYTYLGKHGADDPDLGKLSNLELDAANLHLTRALELDPKSGVKKDLERLARAIKKPATAPDQADPAPGGPVGKGKGRNKPKA